MTGSPLFKRLLDAGMHFTEMSQATAEKLVAEFVKAGEVRRRDAEKAVQQLVDRGRASSEHILGLVQAEVAKQMGRFGEQVNGIESRIEELAKMVGLRPKTSKPAASAAEAAATTKAATTAAAPGKAAATKKAATKKAAATKASVKAAVKAPAKAAGSSGVAKVATKKATKR